MTRIEEARHYATANFALALYYHAHEPLSGHAPVCLRHALYWASCVASIRRPPTLPDLP